MSKTILLVGSGGREHALAWKLAQSPSFGKLWTASGNAGTAEIGENLPIKATDIDGLRKFANDNKPDLTVVGQDDPLALGIVDILTEDGHRVFGPTKAAAELEWSKKFAKANMLKGGVPTAGYVTTNNYEEALSFTQKHFSEFPDYPIMVKADGLALGKGSYICNNLQEAEAALIKIMKTRVHGNAGNTVLIEEFLDGEEISLHAFCDGTSYVPCPSSQDHKHAGEGNTGEMTGGMGTICPVPWFSMESVRGACGIVVGPTLDVMRKEGRPFKGLLYPGLKITESGPKVLEYNVRFGDPETQVLMRKMKSDLLEVLEACIDGQLHKVRHEWNEGFAANIVMASAGYPGNYKKGFPITGIKEAEENPAIKVFHAGTVMKDGKLVTNGGRVLGVSAVGATLSEALEWAYEAALKITFEGAWYRTDIGNRSLDIMYKKGFTF